MKHIVKTIALLVLVSISVAGQRPAETIPAFNFSRLDKTAFTHKNLAPGKMSFFVFFDTDCDHCQHAIQYLDQHCDLFKKAAIYLLTLDSREKINPFMAKYGKNLRDKKNVILLQDTQNEFLQKFRPRKYPSLFLYSTRQQLILYDDNEQNLSRFAMQINASGK